MRVFFLLVKLEQEVWNIITIILGAASTMTNESVPSTGKVGQEVWNIIINC